VDRADHGCPAAARAYFLRENLQLRLLIALGQ
jgi:uncharacterized protein HemX